MRTIDREAGVTLVELMITILLSAMLTSGLFYMFSGQLATYTTQGNTLTAQQSGWGAMEFVQREIRTAGYGFGGCRGGNMNMWDGGAGTKASPFAGARFYNSCNLLTTDPATCPAAPIATPNSPDSFTVTHSDQPPGSGMDAVRITKDMPASSANIFVDAPGAFRDLDIVAIWEPGSGKDCTVMRLSANPQAVGGGEYRLQHAPDGLYNPPGGQNIFPPGGYSVGAFVVNLSGANAIPRHFAIDTTTRPPRLVTWTTSNAIPRSDLSNLEIVAEGIDDLQIAWACDANGDGITAEGTDTASRQGDEWAGNVASDATPICGTVPISEVRISLSVRNGSADAKLRTGFRPAIEDRAAGTAADDVALSGNMGTYPRTLLAGTVRAYNLAGAPQ